MVSNDTQTGEWWPVKLGYNGSLLLGTRKLIESGDEGGNVITVWCITGTEEGDVLEGGGAVDTTTEAVV